jgi:hypothetical protein
MQLKEFLTGLVASGVLGGFGYPLVTYLEERYTWICALEYWAKRLLAWMVSIALGVIPYFAMVAMQYAPTPPDWRAWVEALFVPAFVAITASQSAHAIGETRKRRQPSG